MKNINSDLLLSILMFASSKTKQTYKQNKNIPKSLEVSLRFLVNTGLVASTQSFGKGISLFIDDV